MKWFFRLFSWYIFTWIAIIPIGWYFIGYLKTNFEIVQTISLLTQGVIILGLILSYSFRMFIWGQLRFFYDFLGQVEKNIEKRKVSRLISKDYAFIKKNNA